MIESKPQGVSRRNWVKLAGAAAAGVAALAAGCAPEEKKTVSDSKWKNAPANGSDSAALFEKELGVKMTDEQKKAFPQALKEVRDSANDLRKFALADGGSEPATRFTPSP